MTYSFSFGGLWHSISVTKKKTPDMGRDSEEISMGNVSMKTRKLCMVEVTLDVAKKLTLSHHKGDQRVAFILDEHLITVKWICKY